MARKTKTKTKAQEQAEWPQRLDAAIERVLEQLDSNKKPAPFQPGERVVCYGKYDGAVVTQMLHHDCGEKFWGIVIVKDADGDEHQVHNWQCRKWI